MRGIQQTHAAADLGNGEPVETWVRQEQGGNFHAAGHELACEGLLAAGQAAMEGAFGDAEFVRHGGSGQAGLGMAFAHVIEDAPAR
jgi:hypothetical protein